MAKSLFASPRYREIIKVLIKHGFGFLLAQLGLRNFGPFARIFSLYGKEEPESPLTQPKHLRAALEELGTTFIKFGQILSTRADLLPEPYIEELAKLQSSVPPFSFDEVRQELDRELGEDWPLLFAHFEETPFAAASIGQVHRATLHNGEPIVVKVQRPGIEKTVKEDLAILEHLARLAQQRLRLGKVVDFPGLVREFGYTLMRELNYKREGKNADRFRRHFASRSSLYIPKVYWELTTKRVLTLEEIRGFRIDEVDRLLEAGLNVKQIARECALNVVKMIFEDGFYHADPHPGNFLIQPDGSIALLDFGLVGELDEENRLQMIALYLALLKRNEKEIAQILTHLDEDHPPVRQEELEQDIEWFLERHFHETLAEIHLSLALQDLLDIIYRHRIRVSSHLSLLAKTLIMCEGIGRHLDPEFNLTLVMSEYAPRLYLQKLRAEHPGRKMKRSAMELISLSADAPQLLHSLLRKANSGRFDVRAQLHNTEPLLRELNRMVNRLAISVLTSAFIIGLALLLLVYHPASGTGMGNRIAEWLFIIGFFISIAFGGYVVASIWRSNRSR